VKNNRNVRDLLAKSGIKPEHLAAEEDLKKVSRRLSSEGKRLLKRKKDPNDIPLLSLGSC
jgi:DNA-damage-inducible protein D